LDFGVSSSHLPAKKKTLPTGRMSSTKQQQRENRNSLEGKLDKGASLMERQQGTAPTEKDQQQANWKQQQQQQQQLDSRDRDYRDRDRERDREKEGGHQLPFLLSSNESEGSDSTEDIFDEAHADDGFKKKQRNSMSGYVLGVFSFFRISFFGLF
jgi:hypothetical protein